MIPVTPADEPDNFDKEVRQPGLDIIRELVGEERITPRKGPKRKKVADLREDIPAKCFKPLWRKSQADMLTEYHRLCAYLSLYIERATGSPTIDHVVPKSKAWGKVYEWSNYRLACGLMNSRKGVLENVLDPFEIEEEWFELEFVGYQVKPGETTVEPLSSQIDNTITSLGLNDDECWKARAEYVMSYLNDNIPFSYLKRRAPFIARELQRQGKLRPEDEEVHH